MVGDELIPAPHFSNNESVMIQATPEQVWPWFAQMGFGRAGYFTLAYELEAQMSTTVVRTRARARIEGPLGRPFAKWLLGPGDGVMVRKQLRGVVERAERLAASRTAQLPLRDR